MEQQQQQQQQQHNNQQAFLIFIIVTLDTNILAPKNVKTHYELTTMTIAANCNTNDSNNK